MNGHMLVWYADGNCTISNSIFIPAKYSAIAFYPGMYFKGYTKD